MSGAGQYMHCNGINTLAPSCIKSGAFSEIRERLSGGSGHLLLGRLDAYFLLQRYKNTANVEATTAIGHEEGSVYCQEHI